MKRSAAEKSEFLSLHRENYNSHKSEKNLDNFLFQATKVSLNIVIMLM